MDKLVGAVKWFDNAKGYGFILNDAGEDVFVHYRSIEGEGYKTLAEGQYVEYIMTEGDKGWQAAEVALTDQEPPADEISRDNFSLSLD